MDSIAENRITRILPLLDEKQKRIYLAEGLGYGGIKAIHELTGMSKTTIIRGKKELQEGALEQSRVRKCGGGRKATIHIEMEQNRTQEVLLHQQKLEGQAADIN